jgi:uncharacterized protein YqjF (DUF2071 family)
VNAGALLQVTDHRPWPIVDGGWVMKMRWADLLFAHWPVAVEALRPLIPSGLEVESFDGTGWVGLVPFTMKNVRARLFPRIPSFPELNVRTYVRYRGKPGVWFFSLDAQSRLAVATARTFFCLPYYHARMRSVADGASIHYVSSRSPGRGTGAEFEGRYRATGDVLRSNVGTLEYFLTERYCMYMADGRGRIKIGEIHHEPWPLQVAEIEIRRNTVASATGIGLPEVDPICHYSRCLDVLAWRARGV